MYAGVGALARSVQTGDIRSALAVDVDTAHQIVLAGVNRERLLGHVVALLEHLAVDHREVSLDELGILVGNIQPELIGAGLRLLLHHALGNHVAGSKLLALRLVLLHEALLVAVQQVLNSIASGDRGVRGVVVDSADTAGRQDNRVSAVVLVLLLSRLVVVGEDVREEHSVLLLQAAEHRPVDYGHVFKLLHLLYQVGFDLKAGCILVVGDTAAGVSALAGKLNAAVLLEVELNAVLLLQAHNVGGSLLDKYLYVVEIVLVMPCDEGILYMKLVAVIFLVHNSRNASLGKRGIAERKLSFAQHEDLQIRCEVQRGVDTGDTGADDDNVISLEFQSDQPFFSDFRPFISPRLGG